MQPSIPGSGTPSETNHVFLWPDNAWGKGLVRCDRSALALDPGEEQFRCPAGAALMKFPMAQPGSSTVAFSGTPRRRIAWNIARITTGEVKNWLNVVRLAESYSSGVRFSLTSRAIS